MRYIFFSLFIPFCLISVSGQGFSAESKSRSSLNQNLSSRPDESFYTTATGMVQEQVNLIARIEKAISQPDANQLRSVRGQLTVHQVATESFLKRHYPNPKALCYLEGKFFVNISFLSDQLTEPQAQIYCSLYASSQELSKLAPVLDRLLSRRGELALVRELPLVSGERQSDPVLSIAPIQHPNLAKPATPFAVQEADFPKTPPPIIAGTAKRLLAEYVPPIQAAIAPPPETLATLQMAKQTLAQAISAFPQGTQFQNSWETTAQLDRFSYDLDPQEPQTYAKFLEMPNTGIFRVLPDSAYHRQLNTLSNRLQPSVSERYPFPSLGKTNGGFTPSLALQLVGDKFQILPQGLDYNFMIDLGNIPLEKLDAKLRSVSLSTRQFFLNYQHPRKLADLQVERRRFITGKDQNWNQDQVIFTDAKAVLNHTYLVRSLQFQIPEMILSGKSISGSDRLNLEESLQMQSSDIILAFRPVRRRSDGSYTVLWRVLNQFNPPPIDDLENYVKY
jgi:hypothetical protein